MYKLAYLVPEDHLTSTKQALFDAGAGRYPHYDQCCWQTKGIGQFRPQQDANPHIGKANVVEQVEEWRVEMLCRDDVIHTVVTALIDAHPYEEPAYEAVKLDIYPELKSD